MTPRVARTPTWILEKIYASPRKSGNDGRAGVVRYSPISPARVWGDDVSWKLSDTLRVVGLQTAGTERDRYVWGRWWAECLLMLGADVGVLTETRIASESGHAAAIRGLRDGGYAAVSHNCLTPPPGRLP